MKYIQLKSIKFTTPQDRPAGLTDEQWDKATTVNFRDSLTFALEHRNMNTFADMKQIKNLVTALNELPIGSFWALSDEDFDFVAASAKNLQFVRYDEAYIEFGEALDNPLTALPVEPEPIVPEDTEPEQNTPEIPVVE